MQIRRSQLLYWDIRFGEDPFEKYLLDTYYVVSNILSLEDTTMSKTDKNSWNLILDISGINQLTIFNFLQC